MKQPKWFKCPKWLSVVRDLFCLHCGSSGPIDAHHVDTFGVSAKNPDSMVIPLCHRCHMGHHSNSLPSKEWCREALSDFWTAVTVAAETALTIDEDRARNIGMKAFRLELAEVMDGLCRKLTSAPVSKGHYEPVRKMREALREWDRIRPAPSG